MQINRKTIRNILVVRNDRFGEFLLNIPALRALKETFYSNKIIAVINPHLKELAECVPFIDETIEWAGRKHSFSDRLKLIKLLRKKDIDMAIMLNPSKEFNIITYLSKIPIRVGYDRKGAFLLTHKMPDKKYLGLRHEIEYNLELVGLVGARTKNKQLHINLDKYGTQSRKQITVIEGKGYFIVVHPWTSDPVKQWGLENFVKLTRKLVKEAGEKVVIVGGKEHLNESFVYFRELETDIINLTGLTSLVQLAAVLKKAKLLISGDSGPVHLASCMETPTLAIFSNALPGKGPLRWGPAYDNSKVIQNKQLSGITVEEVFQKAKEMI